ncbi:hypothetical protein H632_c43p0 [Helicosporidium sp. ATCC 50920]|nr:hypothetical protein H632_c43p0 [Helicosporidium sp. ATCC 50920]|eukprot:KDD77003.1 hypothetical protein H632_c43p0 [Helicosporidium sp. ATCC 50920]
MKIRGSIGSANMTTSSSATVALAKVKGPVKVNAGEASEIFVEADPASAESMIITGTARGASVRHTGGKCELSKTSVTSECMRVATPTSTVQPVTWVRGINITDTSYCDRYFGASGNSFGNP